MNNPPKRQALTKDEFVNVLKKVSKKSSKKLKKPPRKPTTKPN